MSSGDPILQPYTLKHSVLRNRLLRHPEGEFQLFRIGDAVASRNIHAAVYDALRLVKDL